MEVPKYSVLLSTKSLFRPITAPAVENITPAGEEAFAKALFADALHLQFEGII